MGHIVGFVGRGWSYHLSGRGDIKGEWDVVFASLQQQGQMAEQSYNYKLYLEELSFSSAKLAMASVACMCWFC